MTQMDNNNENRAYMNGTARTAAPRRKGISPAMRVFVAAMAVITAVSASFGAGVGIGGRYGAGGGPAAAVMGLKNQSAAKTDAPDATAKLAAEAVAEPGTDLLLAAEPEIGLILSPESNAQDYAPVSTQILTGAASVSDIFKAMKDSVVSINMTTQVSTMFNRVQSVPSAGSGIIFDEDDEKIYIVTNYHVIDSASGVTISLDDETTAPANYVGGSEESDIAIISVPKAALKEAGITNYKLASFASSATVEVGDTAIAIGNAAGEGKSATLGIISAVGKRINLSNNISLEVLQTDAAINPGNSGGALVNSKAQVIGINTAKLSDSGIEGMGYAIPSDVVSKLIEQIMNNGTVQRPYLGVSGVTITDQHQRIYNFISKGVYVNSAERNTTAAAAGLATGDVIIAFNGTTITTVEQLAELTEKTDIGATVTFTIIRNNRTELTLSAPMQAYVGRTSF